MKTLRRAKRGVGRSIWQGLNVLVILAFLFQPFAALRVHGGVSFAPVTALASEGPAEESAVEEEVAEEEKEAEEESKEEEEPEEETTKEDKEEASEEDTPEVTELENEGEAETETSKESQEESSTNNGETEPKDEDSTSEESTSEVTETEEAPETVPTEDTETPAVSLEESPVIEEEAEPLPVWQEEGNKATTSESVELGVTYVAPQNENVTVTFTKLPENPGTFSIEEIRLSDKEMEESGSLWRHAYDITSDMEDGTFEYELTLPIPEDADVQVKFAEDISDLKEAKVVEEVENKGDSVAATLDHFTVFIVTDNDAVYPTGSWTTWPVGGFGGSGFHYPTSTGAGDRVEWPFASLSGTEDYAVYVSWSTHPNRSTNVTYEVDRASGSNVSFSGINQEKLADQSTTGGVNEWSGWYLLGTFSLDNSSKVILYTNDNTSGTEYVIADEVRLVHLPDVPTLVSPANGARVQPSAAILDWTDSTDLGNTVTYNYQSSFSSAVGTNNGFTSVLFGPAFTGTASQINATGSADATYYWQVQACDTAGNCSNWSGPWQVTVDSVRPTLAETVAVSSPTADSTPAYVFSSNEAGTITYGGSCSGATTAATVGNNIISFGPLADGAYTDCTLTVTDAAGNASVPLTVTPFTVDATAPDAPTPLSPADGAAIQPVAFMQTWTAEAGAVEYRYQSCNVDPGDAGGVCTSVRFEQLSAGTSKNVGAGQPDSHFWWRVQARDAIGNWSPYGEAFELFIDGTDPTDPTPVSTSHNLSDWDNDRTVSVSWSGASDALSGVDGFYTEWNTDPTVMSGTVVKEHEETVTSETSPQLATGQNHYFHIATVDNAGNWTSTAHLGPFWIDASTPVASWITPTNGALLSGTENLEVSASDPDSGMRDVRFRYRLVGSTGAFTQIAADTSDPFQTTWNTIGVTDGDYTLRALARNTAGGTRTIDITVTVDNTAPVLAQVTPVPSPTNDNTPNYTFSSTEAGTIAYGGDCSSGTTAASVGNTTVTFSTLSDGAHNNCTITVTDAAGNVSSPLAVNTFTVDTIAPDVAITAPTATHVMGSVPIRGSVTDANPHHYFLVIKNSSNVQVAGPGTVNDAASFTDKLLFTWNSNAVPEGVYTIQLEARDAANNKDAGSVATKTVTVDRTPPTADIVFSGTGSVAGASFQVVFNENVKASEATNPANYFLTNWPGAGGSGDLVGDATVTYDSVSHAATVAFNDPANFYVSPEQTWGVQNIHDVAGNPQAVNPYSETSTPMVAPTTTDNVPAGWNHTDVTVTLACDDGPSSTGSGCATTYYTTDGSTPTTASPQGNSILFSTDGVYTVQYFSVDKAGNAESVKTAANQVMIDKTLPTVSLAIDPASPNGDNDWYDSEPTITLSATDNLSGVDRIEYQLNGTGGTWTTYSSPFTLPDGEWQVFFRSSDVAGNQSATGLKLAKVDATDPDEVSDLEAEYDGTVDPDEVNLTWNVDDDDIDEVYIYRGGSRDFNINSGNRVAINDDNDDTYTDDDVERGETYYYKVVTRDDAGNKSGAKVVKIEIPADETVTTATGTDEGTDTLPKGTVLGETTTDEGGENETEELTDESDIAGEVLGAEDTELEDAGLALWQWVLLVLGLGALAYYGVYYFRGRGV